MEHSLPRRNGLKGPVLQNEILGMNHGDPIAEEPEGFLHHLLLPGVIFRGEQIHWIENNLNIG